MSDFCGSAVLHPSLNQPCITCLQTYLNVIFEKWRKLHSSQFWSTKFRRTLKIAPLPAWHARTSIIRVEKVTLTSSKVSKPIFPNMLSRNELPLHRVSRLQNLMVRGTLRNHGIRIADNLSISLWVLKPKGSSQSEQMLLEGVLFKRSNTLRQKL
uniref:Uncharacterized protein n=1 Tax=Glossina palpalis gambiensis TaxID=67801 RepID=A0A1B0AMP3_9MUSC